MVRISPLCVNFMFMVLFLKLELVHFARPFTTLPESVLQVISASGRGADLSCGSNNSRTALMKILSMFKKAKGKG